MQLLHLVSERENPGGLRGGGAMLLKSTMVATTDSMRSGGLRSLAAGRGAMPRGCDGGVDDAMPSREDDGHDGPFLL